MNARQLRLFHKIYAATGSLSAALLAARSAVRPVVRCAADCGPRCGKRVRACARADAPVRPPAVSSRRAQVAESDIGRAVAALETEAVRRALSGVVVPVFHQGRECGSTVKHSDQLLMFLLKTLWPERYGGGKEAAPPAQGRTFSLELDLSAAGDPAGDPAGEGAEADDAEVEGGV